MDAKELKRRAGIQEAESTGSIHLYQLRVSVGGTTILTGVYAESIKRATDIAEKLFGKANIKGRPTKKK